MAFHPVRGARLGAYRLEDPLGSGAFGATWRARDERGEQVAIKLLNPLNPDEVRALASLAHPAIVELISFDHTPTPHLVMRLAPGLPLDQHPALPLGGLSLARVLATLADALAAMHRAGVAHGDLSARNVVLDDPLAPSLRVVDLGASAGLGGTFAFAAPERLRGAPPSPAADLFALGVLCRFLATGALPWADTAEAAAARREPRVPALPALPAWLNALIDELTDPLPALRPTAAQVVDRLAAHGASPPAPELAQLRRRAEALYVRRVAVDLHLDAWLDQGGTLFLAGGADSGRTHATDRLAHELHARARPWTRLPRQADARALADALRAWYPDPDPALLHEPDALADLLAAHLPVGMALLVYDLDTQPVAVQQLTAALARSGALAVCATGALPPGWASTVVELPPFHRAAAAEWAQRLLGEGPVHALLDLLWPCTEGRPGALRDATLQLVADGQLTWQGPRWTLDPNATRPRLPARALPTPADDRDAAQLAAALALHEAPASSELLAEVLGWTPGRVVLTADRLRAAGLLDPTAQHLRWRESLRRPPLDPPQAERLHHAWLRAVLGAAPVSSEALAAHLRHATEPQVVRQHAPAAVEDLLRRDPLAAAALARDLHARWPDDTLALLSLRALFETSQHEALLHDASALAAASPSPETRALARAYLVRVLAHLRPHSPEATEALHQARQEPAPSRGQRALDLAEVQLLAARREPGAALTLASQLATGPAPDALDARDNWARMRTLWAQLALDAQGSDAARRALDPLTDDLPLSPPVRAIVHSVRGRVLLHAGHLPAAEHELRLALAPGSGLTQLDRARSLNNAAILCFQTGDRLRALEHWEAALLVLDRLNLTTERLRTEVNLCIGYREAGRPTRAELAGRWAVQTAQTLRLPHLEAAAASSLCDLHLTTEAYEPALRWHTHAHSLMERHGLEHQRVDLDRQRAEIATHRHEADAAEHAQRAVTLAEQRGGAVELARALAVLAVCHARSGEASRAEAALRDALQAATEAGASADVAELRLWAATAWLALGRAEEARQELARVDAYASEVSDTQRRRRVQRLSAQADALRDERHPRHEAGRLLQLTVELHRLRDVSEILRRITAALIELPDLDRAFVFVGDELRHAASASRPDAPTDPPPRSILGRCLALRAEVVVADVTERGELRHATSVVNLQLRAALCVPLLDGADVVGILYADSRRAAGEDLQATLSYVRALASHAAIAIGRAAQHRALQQELGERQRLSRSKDEFVASISHELRTPLQAILGHTTELLRHAPHERDEPALHHIERAGRRLLSIIDDLLAYADPVEPAREAASFCLRDLLHQISAPHAAAAAAKGLRWALHVDNAATTELLGHQAPLRDLLDRLLDNAVKFTDTGAVTLSAAPSRDLPDTWEFSVRDTGPGLPQRTSHGDAFTLGADATTRRHGGLGLGLALCRRHAIALGSSLVLTCPPTGGTRATFRAHLPRKPGARPPGPLLDATPDRVLVVDDNPVNRLVLSRMVEALGHPCDLAASGAEAVERASERCYLTVLMDCHMPDMDGLQATRHIRQLPVPNRWTPVFAVTADGRGEYRERCMEAGMDQHVVKPLERAQLAAMLGAAVGCWGMGGAVDR